MSNVLLLHSSECVFFCYTCKTCFHFTVQNVVFLSKYISHCGCNYSQYVRKQKKMEKNLHGMPHFVAMTNRSGCGLLSLTALLQRLLVEHVLSQSGSDTLQVGDVVRDLLDGIDLFLQVLALYEVHHLSIAVLVRDLVQVNQGLVD